MRTGLVLWLLLVAAATAVLFRISQDVESLEGAVRAVDAQIAAEEEAIRVLEADWSYLNQPERLRRLADAVTDLAPIASDQIVPSAAVLPMPLPEGERPLRFVGLPDAVEAPPLPARHPSLGPLLIAAPVAPVEDDVAPPSPVATAASDAPPVSDALPVSVMPSRRPDAPAPSLTQTIMEVPPPSDPTDAPESVFVPLPPAPPGDGAIRPDSAQPLMLRVNQ